MESLRELLLLFLVRGPTCRGSFSPAEAFPAAKAALPEKSNYPCHLRHVDRHGVVRPSYSFYPPPFIDHVTAAPCQMATVTSASAKISRPGTFLPGSRGARWDAGWRTQTRNRFFFHALTTGRGIHGIFSLGDFFTGRGARSALRGLVDRITMEFYKFTVILSLKWVGTVCSETPGD